MLPVVSRAFFLCLILFVCVLMFMNPSEANFTSDFKGSFQQAIETDF